MSAQPLERVGDERQAWQAAEKCSFLKGTAFRPYVTVVESARLYRLLKTSALYQGTTLVVP